MTAFADDLKESIRELLTVNYGLTDREKKILETRCLGETTQTLHGLATEFGVSDSRITQVEDRLRIRILGLAQMEPDSPLGQEYSSYQDAVKQTRREYTEAMVREKACRRFVPPEMPPLMRFLTKERAQDHGTGRDRSIDLPRMC